jgi:xylan 1,4-beta-xylosidase
MSGLTFIEYLTNLRLDKAVFSLLTNEKAICKIAYECGFASIKSFNRAFKNAYGISPREYRKRFVSSHVSKT